MKFQITKSNHQPTNPSPLSPPTGGEGKGGGKLRFGIWSLFVIWCLVLGISFVAIVPHEAEAFSLVPCGRSDQVGTADESCTLPHLISLIMRLINYLISTAGIVAMYMVLGAGFDMIFALGNAEKIQSAKERISQAVIGFAIVILAFVFVNLLVNAVLGDPSGAERKWWDPNCIYNITNAKINAECPKLEIRPGKKIQVEKTTGVAGTCKGTATCSDAGVNVCGEIRPANNCAVNEVNKYTSAIEQGAGSKVICSGIDTVKLLKAMMALESSGNPLAASDKDSYGLFQLQVGTANNHKTTCGVTETIDINWLKNGNNATKQACIAAEYAKTLVGPCGCDVKQIAAGYNGGEGACQVSRDCGPSAGAGECTVCADQGSRPTKRWECLYEDPAHSTCNVDRPEGSFSETRKHAPKVQYCYNQF